MNKKSSNLAVACATFVVAFLVNAQDWSSMSGSVTIPEGETWTAIESDMAAVNALSSITVNGELVFSGCTTCPKADLLLGQGTVRKTGTEIWNLAVDQTDFDGNFRIGGGKVVVTTAKPFGKTASGCKGAVYVESGATLKIASRTVKFVWRPIHIAGPGYGVAAEDKALCIDTAKSGAIGLLYLDADATLYVRNNNNYYFVGNQEQPFDDNTHVSTINLGNHTLTKTGAMEWYFLGPSYLGGTIVNAEGSICLRESTKLGAETDGPFIVQNATTFRFYNNPPVVRRPLEVNNTVSVVQTGNLTADGSLPLLRTNCCNWAGAITLNGTSAHLSASPEYNSVPSPDQYKSHDLQMSFFGNISGEGKVTAGRSDRTGTGRIVLGGHNSYSGTTYVYGGASSRLYAYWHDSIPDYSKLTVDRGYVAVRPGMALAADGITMAERWPMEKIFALRGSATFLEDGATAIDATDCTDGTYTITAAELLANDARHDVGLGSAGGVIRITTQPGDVLPITPCAYRGRLELTGGGTYQMVGSNVITSVAGVHSNGPCVAVKGGAKVLQGLAPFYVGCRYKNIISISYHPPSVATVAISNATWKTTCAANPGTASSTGFKRGALYVGSHARGVLDIQKDAVVSNKLQVGGGYYLNWQNDANSYGEGAVYVGDGAQLYITSGGAAAHYASSVGMGGYGYLELAPGGTITTEGNFHIGGYAIGVYHQYGGTFKYQNGTYLNIARMNNGSAVVYLAGGTLSAPHMKVCTGSPNTMTFTVEGSGTVAQTEDIYINEQANAVSIFNINDGGTLELHQFSPYNNTPSVEHPIVVNFDGGCMKKNTYTGQFVAKNPQLIEFAVYGKGMTIDTSRWEARQNFGTPYVGHVSGGVQSVDATAALSYEWVGAPKVVITGGGCGASAVADWDRATRKLKGIKITSHGWGYTQGAVTVKVQTAIKTVSISGANVTVGDNDIGGFTLVGSNTFTLNSTNSWQKWTRVDGGTLKAGSNGAIPANTELVMNGGTLNLNGFDADSERPTTFSGLSGTGGTVINGAVKVVGEWSISASNVLTHTTTALTGALDLDGVTKIVIANPEALAAAEESHVFGGKLFTATSVVWPQNLEVEGLPLSWQVTKLSDGSGLRLHRVRGFTMTFR